MVDLRDGRRYTFYNRMGRLVMSDATGTYPVESGTRGRSTLFRWANMELETYRKDSGNDSSDRYRITATRIIVIRTTVILIIATLVINTLVMAIPRVVVLPCRI